jgi:hypothetical protein
MSLPSKPNKAQKAAIEYAKERAKIERDRLKPWSSAPGLTIGSFAVYPLSMRSLNDLELSGNAFVTLNSQILAGDIAAYIWRHMPEYEPGASIEKFLKVAAKEKDTDLLMGQIANHYESAFIDSPETSRFGGVSQNNKISSIPAIASICHEFGSNYGVNPVEVADMDLRIVFQCCRAIRMSNGDAKFSEPRKLREAKDEYLKEING